MPDAGWFRDPQDPDSELYFDGRQWTTYRRPAPAPSAPSAPPPAPPRPEAGPAPQWQSAAGWTPQAQPGETTLQWQPTEIVQPWAPAGAAGPWAPPPPSRRRNRRPLIAVGAAVVVVAGVVTWLAWPGSDAPSITYRGKPVAAAGKVLTSAETALGKYVQSRHGAQNADTRCYFSKPSTPRAAAKKSDIDPQMLCGPLLFVDGDPAKAYVPVTLVPDVTGKQATLTVPTSLSDLRSQALPSEVKLVRPDGKTPPPGADGLEAPTPPPAAAGVLTTATLGPVAAPTSLADARVVGKTTGFTLEAAGEVPRYGLDDDARSAPAGQKLIAFQLSYGEGDVSGIGAAEAQIVVDGGTPKPVPDTSGGDEWVIVALPKAGSAVLQLKDGGFTQTLSLPAGKPGASNLAVLARRHRTATVRKTASIPVHLSNGGGSADVTFHARMSVAALDFWIPGHETRHAIDGRHAILSTNLVYTDSGSPGTIYGFEPALLRLKLPNGQVIRARNVATGNRIFDVFTVPATFTRGTLQITGSERVDGIDLRIGKTVSIPISFPAD